LLGTLFHVVKTTKDSVKMNSIRSFDAGALVNDAQDFVVSHLHIPSDQLLFELKSLMSALQSELTELINNDYAQFISLSLNLVGCDKLLLDLKTPLEELHIKLKVLQE
jgi:hypothetical protein